MEYQIGDFSRISRLSIKTLRYYHEMEILIPVRIDEVSGYRYYDESSITSSRIIATLKDLDFSIKEIREILEKYSDDDQIMDVIAKKRLEIRNKIEHFTDIDKKINRLLKEKTEREVNSFSNDIIIRDLPEIIAAGIRYKGRYDQIDIYLGKLYKGFGRVISGPAFNLYYDGEYREDDADIETCVPLEKNYSFADMKSRILSGGKAITLIHRGSYEFLGESYKKLFDFINSNKLSIIAPIRETYIKGPGMIFTGNPKNYITEIQIMISN